MVKPAQGRTIEITAYDGMVVFSGFAGDPVIVSAETAEQIGYQLSAAAFAATSGAVRTWSGQARVAPAARPSEALQTAESAHPAPEESRSFMPPMSGVAGSA